MACESVLSFEEYRRKYGREQIRSELLQIVDQWLDGVENCMRAKKPTLDEITKVLFEARYDLMGKVAEGLVKQTSRDLLNQERMECVECGRMLKNRRNVNRTVETMIGPVRISRPYFYCIKCKNGYYPADEYLELSERQKQWDMQMREIELATDVPFERASELFQKMTGLSFSDHSAHEVAGEVGKELMAVEVSPMAEEIEGRIAEVAQGKKRRPIVVLAIDGAHVPIRPEEAKGSRPGRKKQRANRAHWKGQWREAKGFRFYLVDEDANSAPDKLAPGTNRRRVGGVVEKDQGCRTYP